MTLAIKIREHKAANPDVPNKEIAKILKTSLAYVHQVLTNYKKPKKQKLMPVEATDGQKVLRREINTLNMAIEKWRKQHEFEVERNKYFVKEVKMLRDHVAGLEYVVSYLESRLAEKTSGASV